MTGEPLQGAAPLWKGPDLLQRGVLFRKGLVQEGHHGVVLHDHDLIQSDSSSAPAGESFPPERNEKRCADARLRLHPDLAVIGRDHLLHQREAGPAAPPLGGAAKLKEMRLDLRGNAGTGILHTQKREASDSRMLTGDLLAVPGGLVESFDGVFDEIAQNGYIGVGGEPGGSLPAGSSPSPGRDGCQAPRRGWSYPTKRAATEGSPIWCMMRLTASCWVRLVSMIYCWAFSGSPIWRRPRITWSLFMNSWV